MLSLEGLPAAKDNPQRRWLFPLGALLPWSSTASGLGSVLRICVKDSDAELKNAVRHWRM